MGVGSSEGLGACFWGDDSALELGGSDGAQLGALLSRAAPDMLSDAAQLGALLSRAAPNMLSDAAQLGALLSRAAPNMAQPAVKASS